MKYFILSLLLFFVCFSNVEARKLSVVVSIAPQKYFVDKIAKGNVNVEVLVPQGADPHTFEPKPRQLQILRNANIYFLIGIALENKWAEYGREFSPNLRILASHPDQKRHKVASHKETKMKSTKDHDEHHNHDAHHGHEDEHMWLSPKHVIVMVENMRDALIEHDKSNANIYKENAQIFIKEIKVLDNDIKKSLVNKKDRSFVSYHRAWDYFGAEYNLEEIAIETVGKETTAKDIAKVLEIAKEKKVMIAIAQPQHGMKTLELVARTLGIPTRKVDPLAEDWIYTMKEMQKILMTFLK